MKKTTCSSCFKTLSVSEDCHKLISTNINPRTVYLTTKCEQLIAKYVCWEGWGGEQKRHSKESRSHSLNVRLRLPNIAFWKLSIVMSIHSFNVLLLSQPAPREEEWGSSQQRESRRLRERNVIYAASETGVWETSSSPSLIFCLFVYIPNNRSFWLSVCLKNAKNKCYALGDASFSVCRSSLYILVENREEE